MPGTDLEDGTSGAVDVVAKGTPPPPPLPVIETAYPLRVSQLPQTPPQTPPRWPKQAEQEQERPPSSTDTTTTVSGVSVASHSSSSSRDGSPAASLGGKNAGATPAAGDVDRRRLRPSFATQAGALMRKNLVYQKRNWCGSLQEDQLVK